MLDGTDVALIAALAPHAILLVETLSNLGTCKARDRLKQAGFDDVTVLVTGRPQLRRPRRVFKRRAARDRAGVKLIWSLPIRLFPSRLSNAFAVVARHAH